ncbi:hypothetical protein HDU96_003657 [Phlyctochytrium bullatum]|nr:hypothetical protein HDU96_003657 [Phlyctochytrium bullatum]
MAQWGHVRRVLCVPPPIQGAPNPASERATPPSIQRVPAAVPSHRITTCTHHQPSAPKKLVAGFYLKAVGLRDPLEHNPVEPTEMASNSTLSYSYGQEEDPVTASALQNDLIKAAEIGRCLLERNQQLTKELERTKEKIEEKELRCSELIDQCAVQEKTTRKLKSQLRRFLNSNSTLGSTSGLGGPTPLASTATLAHSSSTSLVGGTAGGATDEALLKRLKSLTSERAGLTRTVAELTARNEELEKQLGEAQSSCRNYAEKLREAREESRQWKKEVERWERGDEERQDRLEKALKAKQEEEARPETVMAANTSAVSNWGWVGSFPLLGWGKSAEEGQSLRAGGGVGPSRSTPELSLMLSENPDASGVSASVPNLVSSATASNVNLFGDGPEAFAASIDFARRMKFLEAEREELRRLVADLQDTVTRQAEDLLFAGSGAMGRGARSRAPTVSTSTAAGFSLAVDLLQEPSEAKSDAKLMVQSPVLGKKTAKGQSRGETLAFFQKLANKMERAIQTDPAMEARWIEAIRERDEIDILLSGMSTPICVSLNSDDWNDIVNSRLQLDDALADKQAEPGEHPVDSNDLDPLTLQIRSALVEEGCLHHPRDRFASVDDDDDDEQSHQFPHNSDPFGNAAVPVMEVGLKDLAHTVAGATQTSSDETVGVQSNGEFNSSQPLGVYEETKQEPESHHLDDVVKSLDLGEHGIQAAHQSLPAAEIGGQQDVSQSLDLALCTETSLASDVVQSIDLTEHHLASLLPGDSSHTPSAGNLVDTLTSEPPLGSSEQLAAQSIDLSQDLALPSIPAPSEPLAVAPSRLADATPTVSIDLAEHGILPSPPHPPTAPPSTDPAFPSSEDITEILQLTAAATGGGRASTAAAGWHGEALGELAAPRVRKPSPLATRSEGHLAGSVPSLLAAGGDVTASAPVLARPARPPRLTLTTPVGVGPASPSDAATAYAVSPAARNPRRGGRRRGRAARQASAMESLARVVGGGWLLRVSGGRRRVRFVRLDPIRMVVEVLGGGKDRWWEEEGGERLKTILITGFHEELEDDPDDPDRFMGQLVLSSRDGRQHRFEAPSAKDHDVWVKGLSYALANPSRASASRPHLPLHTPHPPHRRTSPTASPICTWCRSKTRSEHPPLLPADDDSDSESPLRDLEAGLLPPGDADNDSDTDAAVVWSTPMTSRTPERSPSAGRGHHRSRSPVHASAPMLGAPSRGSRRRRTRSEEILWHRGGYALPAAQEAPAPPTPTLTAGRRGSWTRSMGSEFDLANQRVGGVGKKSGWGGWLGGGGGKPRASAFQPLVVGVSQGSSNAAVDRWFRGTAETLLAGFAGGETRKGIRRGWSGSKGGGGGEGSVGSSRRSSLASIGGGGVGYHPN